MTIAEKITRAKADYDAVYEAGKAAGGGAGSYVEGFEAGKQAEYDRLWNEFWDKAQAEGTRTSYNHTFTHLTPDLLPPKYDIRPTTAQNLFATNRYIRGDLRELMGGAMLDLSNATRVDYAFNWTGFTALGTMDFRKATIYWEVFGSSPNLETIELLIMPTQQSNAIDWFNNCKALKYITIQGEIANNINISWSPLTPESMISVITHLKPNGNYAYTCKFSDSCWSALNEAYPAIDEVGYDTWQDYIMFELGWNY